MGRRGSPRQQSDQPMVRADDGFDDGVEDLNKNGALDLGESNPLAFCDPMNTSGACDFDEDGQANQIDTDDDNDNLSDQTEILLGTNPLMADTDSDGVTDDIDHFPLDPTESVDTDNDGLGNNADTDDDNDGVLDRNDAYPLDATRSSIAIAKEKSSSGSGGSLGYFNLILLLSCFRKYYKKLS